MRKHALLLCAALLPLLCACGHRQVRKLELTKGDYSLRQHFDPSLERGLLASRRSPAAAALVDFLNSNSVEMRYAPAASAAPEYVLNERRLFIPQEAKSGTDIFVGVEALRGLEVFRAYETSGLETRVVEFEELGAMLEVKAAIQLGVRDTDIPNNPAGEEFKDMMCTYLSDGLPALRDMARQRAQARNSRAENFSRLAMWVAREDKALSDGTVSRMLNERDWARVQQRQLSEYDARRMELQRSLMSPEELDDIFEKQYDGDRKQFKAAERIYNETVASMETWGQDSVALISGQFELMPYCSTYVPSLMK